MRVGGATAVAGAAKGLPAAGEKKAGQMPGLFGKDAGEEA